jgi:peptidyl-prolyl cis-trans isomerase C
MYGTALAQDDVLAEFGDEKMTVSDLDRAIGYLDAQKQKLIEQNPQYKEQLLNQLVQSMVIADLARKAGYEKRPDVADQLKFYTNGLLATLYIKTEVIDNIEVSEEDIKAFYKEHESEYQTPEMVQARHILFRVDSDTSPEEKKEILKKAEDILQRIKSGEDFAELAKEYSDDTITKENGGDLGFFGRGRMVKSFEDAVFALNSGEVSEIIETKFGYHIIKVDEKKAAALEPYDTVKDSIKQKLSQERVQTAITEFTEKAMKDADVKFHTEVLAGGMGEEQESTK